MAKALRYLTKGEAKVARDLIDTLIARGFSVSVFNGEETVAKHSHAKATILAAMGSTEMDTISCHDESGKRVAWFTLLYGNDQDGSELIADYSNNQVANEIVAQAER